MYNVNNTHYICYIHYFVKKTSNPQKPKINPQNNVYNKIQKIANVHSVKWC
jgi:hypothetical protein